MGELSDADFLKSLDGKSFKKSATGLSMTKEEQNRLKEIWLRETKAGRMGARSFTEFSKEVRERSFIKKYNQDLKERRQNKGSKNR